MITTLTVQDYILLTTSVIAIIPAIPLLRRYMTTEIKEYIQFAFVFFLSSIFCISFVFAEQTNQLLFWQLTFTTRNLTYFIFFFHVTRMLWKDPPPLIFYSGIVLYSIIQVFIILWQTNPSGVGAGFYLFNGNDIFSTDFRLIAIIFQLFVSLTFFYGFYAVQVINPPNRLKLSKFIMLTMAVLLFITRFFRLIQIFGLIPVRTSTEVLGSSILVIGFLIMGATFLYDPNAILLSRVQLGGIMVISPSGTPLLSLKFAEGGLQISPTLMSGIISAIDNVVNELAIGGNEDLALQEIAAKNRVILIDRGGDMTFSLITNEKSTSLLQSSLKYFKKILIEECRTEIDKFMRKGETMTLSKVAPLVNAAFPYTIGLTLEKWE